MKLTATASPMEVLPPKVWEAVKRAVIAIGNEWGLSLEVADDLTVRDAEQRFWSHQRERREGE